MDKKAEEKNLKPRPPIVVVMGHVDHGKTTLLDYIRKTSFRGRAASERGEPRSVAEREAGGITQSVGAYEIAHGGKKITFIDTPGHEAFSRMRSRGAEVADLAILVVASDDGVKPQTKEAIQILNDAKTPFIVAINKIDRTNSDIEKTKKDLANVGVLLEGYGGNISYHGISAKTGEGVNDLLDLIVLASDLENLTYDPSAHVEGFILEVRHDSRRGSEASVIVKNGTLVRGESIYTKTTSAKVKILENFLEEPVQSLVPSAPAVIIGFEKLPQAGEEFSGVPFEIKVEKTKAKVLPKKGEGAIHLILKAADAGSLEALSQIIRALEKPEAPLTIIEESVGEITDGDLKSAIATGANIIGFNVKTQKGARNLAKAHDVRIVTSDIIYDLVKTVEEFFKIANEPRTIGELTVLAVFNQKRLDEQLVGGKVTTGAMRIKAPFEIRRGSTPFDNTQDKSLTTGAEKKAEGQGRILTLRDKKTNVNQAETGKEIGLVVSSQLMILVGDQLVIRK